MAAANLIVGFVIDATPPFLAPKWLRLVEPVAMVDHYTARKDAEKVSLRNVPIVS
jgi:hypothetical protein